MCGRFTSGKTQAELLAVIEGFLEGPFRVDDAAPEARPSWNIKPTEQVRILGMRGGEGVLTTARWWFVPHWHKGAAGDWKATTFNAKIETAGDLPTFRTAWASGRCLIPATGYFEWTGTKGAKQPWFVRVRTNQPLFWFAGLASRLTDGLRTCTILTRPALPEIADLHPRMPVILAGDEAKGWLAGGAVDPATLGSDWQGRIDRHRVRRFGIPDDGPELNEPEGLGF
ncbi:MAG: SOS response-associated peptidase [Albidovulum sp.]